MSFVQSYFGNTKEKGTHEVAFRRWLMCEIDAGRITVGDAAERFNLNENRFRNNLHRLCGAFCRAGRRTGYRQAKTMIFILYLLVLCDYQVMLLYDYQVIM